MIKKGLLFSFVAVCSLFFLTACKTQQESNEPELQNFERNLSFDTLKEAGFIPPVVKLPDSYVNDKIESKAKKLSYEFYYYALPEGEEFVKVKNETVFAYRIHSATIAEEDSGDASKTKIKYDKLRAVNGGDICVGTKFIMGLIVKDQSDDLVYHSISKYTVTAPRAMSTGKTGEISVAGDQTGFDGQLTASEGTISGAKYDKDTNERTVYTLTGASNRRVSLKYGDFGSTNKVLVK